MLCLHCRWKFVVHGGIDGYSRLITYLSVSTNNLAETVLRQFVKAADIHGVPSRVRMDYGAENWDVAEFMLIHRGTERGSVITGKSVHNQRIETVEGCVQWGPGYILQSVFFIGRTTSVGCRQQSRHALFTLCISSKTAGQGPGISIHIQRTRVADRRRDDPKTIVHQWYTAELPQLTHWCSLYPRPPR